MIFRTSGAATALLAMLLFSASGFAKPPAQTTGQPASKLDRNDPHFVSCRRQALPGVILRYKKICKTRAEWIADGAQMQDDLEAAQNRGLINSCATLTCS